MIFVKFWSKIKPLLPQKAEQVEMREGGSKFENGFYSTSPVKDSSEER